jgi:hypothetical protein
MRRFLWYLGRTLAQEHYIRLDGNLVELGQKDVIWLQILKSCGLNVLSVRVELLGLKILAAIASS